MLIPPDKGSRGTPRPGWTGGRYEWMRRVLSTEHGQRLYRKRAQTVEPLFGNTKHNAASTAFTGEAGSGPHRVAILMMTHNLGKLHRHQLAAAAA